MGTVWQLCHSGNKHYHLRWTCREWLRWKWWSEGGMRDCNKAACVCKYRPTTCWLGRSENADAHGIWNVSLILQSVFIRIGGLSKWTECFQSRHVSNCHRPSVLSHLPAFLSFSLYFITYWLTSWVLQVHKSPSFKRLLGFWVCRLSVLEKIWYLKHSNKELHLPSFSFICKKSKASNDSVIMMKQI